MRLDPLDRSRSPPLLLSLLERKPEIQMEFHPVVLSPVLVSPEVVMYRSEPRVRADRNFFVWVRMDQHKEYGEEFSPRHRLNGARKPAVNAPVTN